MRYLLILLIFLGGCYNLRPIRKHPRKLTQEEVQKVYLLVMERISRADPNNGWNVHKILVDGKYQITKIEKR
jgi:hypothetical protein